VVLPPPPGYVVGGALATGLAFGAGIAITAALWNLGRPNWGGGYVNVNVNRYNNLAVNTHRISTTTYRPRYPNAARPGVRPPPPNGPVGRPRPGTGLPANAIGRPAVRVPGSAVNRPPRSPGAGTPLPNRPNPPNGPPGNRPAPNRPPLANPPGNRPGPANRPNAGAPNRPNPPTPNRPTPNRPTPNRPTPNRPAPNRPAPNLPAPNRPAPNRPTTRPAALSDMRDGRRAGQLADRGGQSRAAHQRTEGRGPAGRPHGGARLQRP
jgi:hypothetical protein